MSRRLLHILGKELKRLFDNFQLQMSMDSAAYTGITFFARTIAEQPVHPSPLTAECDDRLLIPFWGLMDPPKPST